MVDEIVVKVCKEYLGKVCEAGISVSFGVVFGSYVSGCADELSDIDLVVVSPMFDGVVSRDYVKKLW